MSFEARFRQGEPLTIDYTPAAGDIAAGQVVLLGNTSGLTCGIAHGDIANNRIGALAIGHGVYEVLNLNNAANYVKVWWDDTNNKVTTVSTNNAQFGFVIGNGGLGANTVCYARHTPYV